MHTTTPTPLHLMECDLWICSDCWDELADSYLPFDLPAHQWIHVDHDPARHDPYARCAYCHA